MPYPNPADPELRERMRFMDAAAAAVGAAAHDHTAGVLAAPSVEATDGLRGAEYRQLEASRGHVGLSQNGTASQGSATARVASKAGAAGARQLLSCEGHVLFHTADAGSEGW